jgi:hypothetical protein
MKIKLCVAVLILAVICPPVSHGFGLLRFTFDAVANQLGLDRGPIPKVPPRPESLPPDPRCQTPPNHRSMAQQIYIQAEGF